MANIKVAVRVRPISSRELNVTGSKVVIHTDLCGISLTNLKVAPSKAGDSRERTRRYGFDYCFDSSNPEAENYADQTNVYQTLGQSVLDAVFSGYNACLVAYGQSASGKTYTMMGTKEDPGLTPRLCAGIFERIEEEKKHQKVYRVFVSYLEIYNERVRDLLKPSTSGSGLRVREHPKLGPHVQGLTHHAVHTLDSLMSYVEEGTRARKTAATLQNPSSSRSHALLTIALLPESIGSGYPGVSTSAAKRNECWPRGGSKLHLVDLAGSESAATCSGVHRLKEGANINKSLVALGNVISALAERGSTGSAPGRRFIPYRDSSLTWLLKDALGGNATTIMLATISPASGSYNETAHTLRFAQRAQSVVNRPVVNENPVARIIRELRAEVARLKSLLLEKDIAPEVCSCKGARTLEDPIAHQESTTGEAPIARKIEEKIEEEARSKEENERERVSSPNTLERFNSTESLIGAERRPSRRSIRRFGSCEFPSPKNRLGYKRAEVSELNDDEEDEIREIHESVFVDIPTLVAVLIKSQDGSEGGPSQIEEICSDEVPEDSDDVDLIEASTSRSFDENPRRDSIDAHLGPDLDIEEDHHHRDPSNASFNAPAFKQKGKFEKQDSIDASISPSNLQTSRRFGSVEAIQRKKEPFLGLERSHTSLEKRAGVPDRGKKLNNIREIDDGRGGAREAHQWSSSKENEEQLQRKGSNDSDKSLKDSNGKATKSYARKPSLENLRRKTSKDSSSSSSKEEQQIPGSTRDKLQRRKSSLEQEPAVPRAHTPIQRVKRAEIVAAVTERLYSSRKHAEEAAPSGVRSPPEGTEVRQGTSAFAARSKLQELSRKMLAKRRRVCADTQTEDGRTIRVRDVASLTEEKKVDLQDVGVLTEEHESCETLGEHRTPVLRVKEIATLTDKPRTSIVRCRDVGSLATDLEDYYYELHSPRNDSGILSDDTQNYAESNLSSAEASDLCPETDRRVAYTENSMNTILQSPVRSCAVQTVRQDAVGPRKAPGYGRSWCNSTQEACRVAAPNLASQKVCARRCCERIEESCASVDDQKSPVCVRQCCDRVEESCDNVEDRKAPICVRPCCHRVEDPCDNVDGRTASMCRRCCCNRMEEACDNVDNRKTPICARRCCNGIGESCDDVNDQKTPICRRRCCDKIQVSCDNVNDQKSTICQRRCCDKVEQSCDNVDNRKSVICQRLCCDKIEESCDNVGDRKTFIGEGRCCDRIQRSWNGKTSMCARECCGRIEESYASVDRRKAPICGRRCCARLEESCNDIDDRKTPICDAPCCAKVKESCNNPEELSICSKQCCSRIDEAYERIEQKNKISGREHCSNAQVSHQSIEQREAPSRGRQRYTMQEESCENVKQQRASTCFRDRRSIDETLASLKITDSAKAHRVSSQELDRPESTIIGQDPSPAYKSSAHNPAEEYCQNASTVKSSNIPEKSVISISLPDMISITIESSSTLESRIALVESIDLPAEKSTSATRNSEAQTDRKENTSPETRDKPYLEDPGRSTVTQTDGKVFRIENIFEDPRSSCRSCSKDDDSRDSTGDAREKHSVTFTNSLGTSSCLSNTVESVGRSMHLSPESERRGSLQKEGSITEAFISKKRSASLSPKRQDPTICSFPWSSWTLPCAMRTVRSADHLSDLKTLPTLWALQEDQRSKQLTSPFDTSGVTRLEADHCGANTTESMPVSVISALQSCEVLERDYNFSDDSLDHEEECILEQGTPSKTKKIECTEVRESLCPPDVVAHTKKETPTKAMDEVEVLCDFEDNQVEFPRKKPSCSTPNAQVHDYKSLILGTSLEGILNDDQNSKAPTTCVESEKKKVSFLNSSGSNETDDELSNRRESNLKHSPTNPVLKSIMKKKKKIRPTDKLQSSSTVHENETENPLRENTSTFDPEFDYAGIKKKNFLSNPQLDDSSLDSKEDLQTDECLQADNAKLAPESNYPRTRRKPWMTLDIPNKASKEDLRQDESSRGNNSKLGPELDYRRNRRKLAVTGTQLGSSGETLGSKEDQDTDESSEELNLNSSNHRKDLSSDERSDEEDPRAPEKNILEEYLDEAVIFMRNMSSINEYMSATGTFDKYLGRARRRRARRRTRLDGDYVEYEGQRVSLKDDTEKYRKREEEIEVPTESYERCVKGIQRLESCIRKVDRENEMLRGRYGMDVESTGARLDLASPSTDLKASTGAKKDPECAKENPSNLATCSLSANSSILANRGESLLHKERNREDEDSRDVRAGGCQEDEVERRIFDQLMSEVAGEEYRSSIKLRNVPGTRLSEIKSQSPATRPNFRQRSSHVEPEFRQDVGRIPNLRDNPTSKVTLGDIRDTPTIPGVPAGYEISARPSIAGRIGLLRRTSAIQEQDTPTRKDSRLEEDLLESCDDARSIYEGDRFSSAQSPSPRGERIPNDPGSRGGEVNCPIDWAKNSRWSGHEDNRRSEGLGDCTFAGMSSKVEAGDIGSSYLGDRVVRSLGSTDEGTRLRDKLKYPGSPRAKFLELLRERRRIVESTRGTGAS